MVRDPDTGRRVLLRANARQDWHVVEVPELAIVPVELFQAAQGRIKARSDIAPTYLRKPKRPLSGLLRCAACGGGMWGTHGKKKGEPKRVRCTRDAETGTCRIPGPFIWIGSRRPSSARSRVELRHPDVIAEFVRTYHEERRRPSLHNGVPSGSPRSADWLRSAEK